MVFNKSMIVARLFLVLLLSLFLCPWANAHLMKAQHGTLNFVDGGVYMVLSLPVSAFNGVDEDRDGKLSVEELNHHRSEIVEAIRRNVILTDGKEPVPLEGILLSPVVPHDAPEKPASHLTVMGRFALGDTEIEANGELRFEVGLYGDDGTEQSLEITAKRQARSERQVFELTSEESVAVLFASK